MNDHLPKKTPSELDRLLVKACADREYGKIPALLDAGADPNAVDPEEEWPPLCALVYHSPGSDERNDLFVPEDFWKALDLLLRKGADINQIVRTSDGGIFTALLYSQYTAPEVARFLLEHGADPDVVDGEGETVLDAVEFDLHADYEGRWKNDSDYWVWDSRIRKTLLDHGAHRAETLAKMDGFEQWDEVRQKICRACWHLEAAGLDRVLTDNPITLPDGRFGRLFYEAVKTAPEFMQKHFIGDPDGYEDRLIALLDVFRKHGIDLNADGGDALFFSVLGGYVKTARYLLAHGADPDKCDCGCWYDSADRSPEHRHCCTLAGNVLNWRCRWKKETALAFQEMFPYRGRWSYRLGSLTFY